MLLPTKKPKNKDYSFLYLILLLLTFGVLVIYSSTVVYAKDNFNTPYRFVLLHLGWILLGSAVFGVLYKSNYKKLEKYAYGIFFTSLIPLALTGLAGLVRQLGLVSCSGDAMFIPCINGASRWFYINPAPFPKIPFVGVFGFQTSEFAKIALILYLALLLSRLMKSIRGNSGDELKPFYTTFSVLGLVAFLVFLQPNLSTAILIFAIGISMYFVSGASLKPLFIAIPVLFLLGVAFMFSSSYRRARIMTFMNSNEVSDLSMGYHIKQVQIALGSGGFMGVGFGQSKQKFQYLPEVSADSIFAIIGEELGFVGTTSLLVVFMLFLYKGYSIAINTSDLFGKLICVGVMTWFGVQFFINIAAMTRIIPLTGVPLPLISYGGSSMLFGLTGLGIVASISRSNTA